MEVEFSQRLLGLDPLEMPPAPHPLTRGSSLCFAGLQPPLVSRVWEFLLHHRNVFESQLQLQVLQDGGPSSPK